MFSVVVPVYNHQEYVTTALLSATQSPLVTEVLVVDDGSQDRSAQVIEQLAASHPKIALLRGADPGNQGAHSRLNALVRQAREPWVAVLNSDDDRAQYSVASATGQFPPARHTCIWHESAKPG